MIGDRIRVLFIGNRVQVLDVCLSDPDLNVVSIFVQQGSPLEVELTSRGMSYRAFAFRNKEEVIRELEETDFDVLVSNGCPFILPVDRLRTGGRLLVNTHPALLPGLSGPHPVNALFLRGLTEFGATTHLMSDLVDAGAVLARVRMDLTPDLDVGLVYRLAFRLEALSFREALGRIKQGSASSAEPQQQSNAFYKRRRQDMVSDAGRQSAVDIEKKIKAFGTTSLGLTLTTRNGRFRIFDGAAVVAPRAVELLSTGQPGAVICDYDGKLLVETPDGLLRLIRFEKL